MHDPESSSAHTMMNCPDCKAAVRASLHTVRECNENVLARMRQAYGAAQTTGRRMGLASRDIVAGSTYRGRDGGLRRVTELISSRSYDVTPTLARWIKPGHEMITGLGRIDAFAAWALDVIESGVTA